MSNYASYSALGKDPKAPTKESMAEIPKIISQEHRDSFKQTFPIVIIENYTDWCAPCKIVAPLFARLAKKYSESHKGIITFVKENVDDDIPGILSVRGVPCFHFFIKGEHIPEYTVTGGNIETIAENIKKIFAK